MSLIGVVTEHKNETYLKKKLEKVKQEDVFFLSEGNIENMRNIKFETFLLGKNIEKKQDIIRLIAKNASYFILNSDIKENLYLLDKLNLMLITYGHNQKATVTTSSIGENKAMICLQRNIKNIYGKDIEPQEIEIDIEEDVNDDAIMELAILNLLYKQG